MGELGLSSFRALLRHVRKMNRFVLTMLGFNYHTSAETFAALLNVVFIVFLFVSFIWFERIKITTNHVNLLDSKDQFVNFVKFLYMFCFLPVTNSQT